MRLKMWRLNLQNGGAAARGARGNVGRRIPHHWHLFWHFVHHVAAAVRGQRVVDTLMAPLFHRVTRLNAHFVF
jgi:hypothetical protein